MQQTLRMKVLIGILVAVSGLAIVLVHELHVNQQSAAAARKLAAERDKAEQIDRDDKAAIQKIRERNAQKASPAPNQ